jgi:hypothetical protein
VVAHVAEATEGLLNHAEDKGVEASVSFAPRFHRGWDPKEDVHGGGEFRRRHLPAVASWLAIGVLPGGVDGGEDEGQGGPGRRLAAHP